MATVGAFEAKTKLSELLDMVERGEEVTITRHGAPIAKLVPVRADDQRARVHELIRRIRDTRKGRTLGGTSVRELIDDGRRYK